MLFEIKMRGFGQTSLTVGRTGLANSFDSRLHPRVTWCARQESNLQPDALEATSLTIWDTSA